MPRVFISYRQIGEAHIQQVRDLATRLRTGGVEVELDYFYIEAHPGGPPEGWPMWCSDRAKSEGKVVVAASALWFQRFDGMGQPGTGLGVASEAGELRQRLYDQGGVNDFLRVVYFEDDDLKQLSHSLKRYHCFHAERDFGNLLRWITKAPGAPDDLQMSLPPGQAPAPPPAPSLTAGMLRVIKSKAVILPGVLLLVAVLLAFFTAGTLRLVSSLLAAPLLAAGAWAASREWQRWKRDKAREQERAGQALRLLNRTAFRNLEAFGEDDNLPGEERRRAAKRIADQIAGDDFSFGILCGDSGAGKTSLIRTGVVRVLRSRGLTPVYVRSPRRLTPQELVHESAAARLAAEIAAFEAMVPVQRCVLILDQFEEWFLEYREPELRAMIGNCIAGLIRRQPPVRVLCAVRREFMVDFHDLGRALADPTNPNNTFRVRNFTVEQAAGVISECARADDLKLEDDFAETLATDLSDNGEVRPPELQIVCTALSADGELTTQRYQAAGGTAGILSHSIKDALKDCRDPVLGAKLLRALCDFPTRTKRKAKTLEELIADTGAEGPTGVLAGQILESFSGSRLLAKEPRRGAPDAYALMHDYLVGAVDLATKDVSTQTEEANQFLRYYLAQQPQHDAIPHSRLRFIRKHAERALLEERKAKKLIRKSAAKLVVKGSLVALMPLLAAIYLFFTAGVRWEGPVEIGRHHEGNLQVGLDIAVKRLGKGNLITGAFEGSFYPVKIWDARSAVPVKTTILDPKGGEIRGSGDGSWVIVGSDLNLMIQPKLVRVADGKSVNIPSFQYYVPDSATYVAFSNKSDWDGSGAANSGDSAYSAFYWSLQEELTHKVTLPRVFEFWRFIQDGSKLLVLGRDDESRWQIQLYDALSGKNTSLTTRGYRALRFAIHDSSRQVVTLSRSEGKELENSKKEDPTLFQIWNLDTGELIREKELRCEVDKVAFDQSGRYLSCGRGFLPEYHVIVSAESFEIVGEDLRHADGAFFWGSGSKLKMWIPDGGDPFVLDTANPSPKGEDKIQLSPDHKRLAIDRGRRSIELWNIPERKLIRKIDSRHAGSSFSMNSTAVVVVEDGGLASLFDADDGVDLAQHFPYTDSEIYYDPELRRFHVWSEQGAVQRCVEGRYIFGIFVPTRHSADR